MESRPYSSETTPHLEAIFKEDPLNLRLLRVLADELSHRERPRAVELREEIRAAIESLEQSGGHQEEQEQAPEQTTAQSTRPPTQKQLSKEQVHAINVIEYLAALARVNSVIVRDISSHQSVLWFADVPRDATNCYARSWGADESFPDDIWLEVKKMQEPALPALPKGCENWITLSQLRNPDTTPALKESISVVTKAIDPITGEEFEKLETKMLADNPALKTAWDSYVQQKWQPWIATYKRYLDIQHVFGVLYSIYQEQQRLGEQYELIVSLGLLTWKQPNGQSVRRHLLVAKASLEFESAIGRFVVKPAPDGDQAELELDMLEPECYPSNASMLVAAGRQLRDNFWDRTTANSILSSVSNSLEGQGRGVYNAETERSMGATATDIPLIEFAPALILRKRSQKGLLNILADMLRQVESGLEMPGQFLDLCEVGGPDDQGDGDGEGEREPGTFDHIYFPLPANEQQRQIIKKLYKQRGVLVQGPPGTGKSQTISNLICHLLATGQRVLVTAKSARALEVLHEKIPDAVSPLCISMLGSGTEERESLERSVNGIQKNVNSHNELAAARKKEELEQKLHENKKAKAEAEYALVGLRERETFQHTAAGGAYTGTAAAIAIKLQADEQLYNWFGDEIGMSEELPLVEQEVAELATQLVEISRESEAELTKHMPDPKKELPDCDTLRGLWQAIADYEQSSKGSHERLSSLAGKAISKAVKGQITALGTTVGQLIADIESVNRRPMGWVSKAVKDVLVDLDTPWKQLHKLTTDRLGNLKKLAEKSQSDAVEIPAGIDLRRLGGDAKAILDHLNSGGSLKQFVFMEHPVLKKHGESVRQVRVNGQECIDKSLLPKLLDYLSVKFLLEEIWSLWVGKTESHAEKHPLMQIAEIDELLEALAHALDLYSSRAKVIEAISVIPELARPKFEDIDSLIVLATTCQDVLNMAEIKLVVQKLLAEEGRISSATSRNNAHPICAVILQSFKDKDPDKYCEAISTLQVLATQCARVTIKQKHLKRLAAKAPLFTAILMSEDNQVAIQHLKDISKAWAWRQASDWMRNFKDQDGNMLERNIRRYEIMSAKALEELAALKAWDHCFSRMTREHQEHLESWHQSMRRLGKGTGKHAHKHRLDAQKSLNECKGAVPAWIMPLHRVYETVEASPGAFDVIIVDEASQCGYEGLPLLYLAKKIIVVGDEKQISPEAVGINRNHVFTLMRTHLADFKHSASFDIENSLFAHGQIRFGNRITLCEHFRCAPEIIRFSNENFYTADPLIPLKQVPPNRLEPLKAVHVPSGYRDGSGQAIVNRPEAEALVKQLIECCRDKRYDGMTMGVIVLQGDTQAKIIEDMLVKQLGTEEMQERRLLCGNPYSFQGDERDIIFLSMVAATNERIGALTQEKDMRRFNVAASRAREQMWLFHSVTSNDLSAVCLRKLLYNHFYNTTQPKIAGIAVDDLRRAAHVADRWREEAPPPFDSWFEVDVALRIASHGYTIVPQFEFAGKRIDLVIQGGSAQLAVECDGDHWHGRDKFEEDMQRQRMLERCNWVFFRVRESDFRVNEEVALEQLWDMLDARGIYPSGSDKCDDSSSSEEDGQVEEPGDSEQEDVEDAEVVSDYEEADDDGEAIEGCPVSIQGALNLKPADLRGLIVKAMTSLPNRTCVRKSLTTIILKKCHIRTRGTPRKAFDRKVESQVAAMIRDGYLVAYKSVNERLKLGWAASE